MVQAVKQWAKDTTAHPKKHTISYVYFPEIMLSLKSMFNISVTLNVTLGIMDRLVHMHVFASVMGQDDLKV